MQNRCRSSVNTYHKMDLSMVSMRILVPTLSIEKQLHIIVIINLIPSRLKWRLDLCFCVTSWNTMAVYRWANAWGTTEIRIKPLKLYLSLTACLISDDLLYPSVSYLKNKTSVLQNSAENQINSFIKYPKQLL